MKIHVSGSIKLVINENLVYIARVRLCLATVKHNTGGKIAEESMALTNFCL